ncbi:cysteine hydrolase family protein [Roseateles amylovorans]|uniref:Isochorismatase family protein n=1 Tax=Roseateles amylovorans TaxID=2978473 RepID=A0ABY6AXI0_9BURK|nr:isochorismatase family protein [Roseateles amylovorans]UXH77500.1 isochorismatase family protein [Roseateles amylovorans]
MTTTTSPNASASSSSSTSSSPAPTTAPTTPPTRRTGPDTAVLLIDVQESFRHRPYWDPAALPEFLARTRALLDGAAARGLPVVRILHSDGPDTPDNPFALVSGHVRPLEELAQVPVAAEFLKRRHSALVGTGLSVWLTENGIRRLIVTGIRTEQCCETTTRHASDAGWEVDYVTEATLTFPMRHASGVTLSVADIKLRTELVLQDRFAQICSVEQALDRAQ